jgi:hypothetical protein
MFELEKVRSLKALSVVISKLHWNCWSSRFNRLSTKSATTFHFSTLQIWKNPRNDTSNSKSTTMHWTFLKTDRSVKRGRKTSRVRDLHKSCSTNGKFESVREIFNSPCVLPFDLAMFSYAANLTRTTSSIDYGACFPSHIIATLF